MSDGITDAERMKREEVEIWRKKVKEQFVSELSIKELVAELCKREGITEFVVPERCATILPENMGWIMGPARFLVVRE